MSLVEQQPFTSIPQNIGDLEEYIAILSEHQVNCEKQGKYVEADIAKQRITELKQVLECKKRDEMKQKHITESTDVEKAHLDEFNQFNEFWDRKMEEFNLEAGKIEQELIVRQEDEFKKVNEELEKAIQLKPKESSELLNMRKIEEHLAKQKKYPEAHQVQQKRLQQEKEENQAWSQARQNKINNQLKQLKIRQNNELNVLKQRILAGQEEQRKNRSIELERLLQKYQNVKKEIEAQHYMDVLSFERQIKSRVQTSRSGRIGGSKALAQQIAIPQ